MPISSACREIAYSKWRIVALARRCSTSRGATMSKGMDRKKEGKKKPAKSLQEKRAAKREKKQSRGFQLGDLTGRGCLATCRRSAPCRLVLPRSFELRYSCGYGYQ